MNRPATIFLLLIAATMLTAGPALAQCLDGNCVNGEGVKLTRGHKYSGSFKNNHRNGSGLYEYPNGDKYEGNFVDGIIQGEGIYYFVNGDRYEGAFIDDKRHGVGAYYPVEGRILKGVWEKNTLAIQDQMVESEILNDALNLDLDALTEDEADTVEPPSEEELDAMVEEALK